MTANSLPHPGPQAQSFSVKEFSLVVRDAPAIPAEIDPFVGAPFRSSAEIFERFQGLAEMPVETFVAIHLDGRNRLVGMTTCSIGSLTASLAHPRDIFRPAIANLTAGLIFLHNHPSGDPEPSAEDRQITHRRAAAVARTRFGRMRSLTSR